MTTLAPAKIAFEHILIPTDFSDLSQRAVEYAEGIAKEFHSQLFLLHVNEPINPITPAEAVWIDQESIRRQWSVRLAKDGEKLRSAGFQAETSCVIGGVKDEVLSFIKEKKIDLIVMGTHGRIGLERLLFGSEAEGLSRRVPCPVLVIGPSVAEDTKPVWPPRYVLCATTLDPDSAWIAAYAFQLAEEHQAEFLMMNVGNTLLLNKNGDWTRFEDAFRKNLPPGIAPAKPLQELFGDVPGDRIVDAAKERQADLIVMGARSASSAVTHLLRGTVPQVFTDAPCPVMTLHQ